MPFSREEEHAAVVDAFENWQPVLPKDSRHLAVIKFVDGSEGHTVMHCTRHPRDISLPMLRSYILNEVLRFEKTSCDIDPNDGSYISRKHMFRQFEIHTHPGIIDTVRKFLKHDFALGLRCTALYLYADPSVHFIMYFQGTRNTIFPSRGQAILSPLDPSGHSNSLVTKSLTFFQMPDYLDIIPLCWSTGLRFAGLANDADAGWFVSSLPALMLLADVRRFLTYCHTHARDINRFLATSPDKETVESIVLIRHLADLLVALGIIRHAVTIKDYTDRLFRLRAWDEDFVWRGSPAGTMCRNDPVEFFRHVLIVAKSTPIRYNLANPSSPLMPSLLCNSDITVVLTARCPLCRKVYTHRRPIHHLTVHVNQTFPDRCRELEFLDVYIGEVGVGVCGGECRKRWRELDDERRAKGLRGPPELPFGRPCYHLETGDVLMVFIIRRHRHYSDAEPNFRVPGGVVDLGPLLVPCVVDGAKRTKVMLPVNLIIQRPFRDNQDTHDPYAYVSLVYGPETFGNGGYGDPYETAPVVYRGVTSPDDVDRIKQRPWLVGQLTFPQITERFGSSVVSAVYRHAYTCARVSSRRAEAAAYFASINREFPNPWCFLER